jgi:hypothetical protein
MQMGKRVGGKRAKKVERKTEREREREREKERVREEAGGASAQRPFCFFPLRVVVIGLALVGSNFR